MSENMSEDRVLGRIGITLKGEYDSNKKYTKLNQVTYNGGSYTLKVAEATGILPTDTDYWVCSAKPGAKGEQGVPGQDGKDGEKGEQGEPGQDGKNGKDGKDGINGVDGKDGYTPQKGTDYFTEEEKEEFKSYCNQQIGIIETLLQEV